VNANKRNSLVAHSTTGINGYDAVAYFTEGKPTRGNGHHVAVFDGVTYLFASEENKKKFEANPEQYIPAYGGYCAYGVSVEKKFVGDPEVWKIVDGELYLNLDKDIQSEWEKDVSGHIRKADSNWPRIKDTPPSDLR
jgi:YHS domain-containing protein